MVNVAQADVDLVDETFDCSQSESYHLSIQSEPDRLSFCVVNTVLNKCIVLRSYRLPTLASRPKSLGSVRSVFDSDEMLRLKYKSSCCLSVSPRYTFVPEHLFAPTDADEYLTFNLGATTGEQAHYHLSRAAKAYHVFSCPEDLTALLRTHHPSINFFHHSKPFLESVLSDVQTGIAVCFYSKWMDILAVKNKKMLFYNSFQINAPADSVYYLAGAANMFDFQLSSLRLTYAGNVKQMPPEISILKNYVGQIVGCEPLNAVTYSHYITETFRRNFINLINSYGCES